MKRNYWVRRWLDKRPMKLVFICDVHTWALHLTWEEWASAEPAATFLGMVREEAADVELGHLKKIRLVDFSDNDNPLIFATPEWADEFIKEWNEVCA